MPQVPSNGPFSEDGYWWWDGAQWRPAFSADRKWRFDGTTWQRVGGVAWRWAPVWQVLCAAIWCLGLAVWMPITVPLFNTDPASVPGSLFVLILGTPTVAGLALGYAIGRTAPLYWVWIFAAPATLAQLFGYVQGMLEAPQPGGAEDIAAGAGVGILFVPVSAALLGLLWAGAGVAHWLRLARGLRRGTAVMTGADE
ncbi:MAG: hypothetical protein FWD85_02790 [Microbacteriaceae bacterium]|nr:hypothetical protein [Microbacteriaceae bacterium]